MKRSHRLRCAAGGLAVFGVVGWWWDPVRSDYLFVLAAACILVAEIIAAIEDGSR